MHGLKTSILEFAQLPSSLFVFAASVENILQKIISHFFPRKKKKPEMTICLGGEGVSELLLYGEKTSRYLYPKRPKPKILFSSCAGPRLSARIPTPSSPAPSGRTRESSSRSRCQRSRSSDSRKNWKEGTTREKSRLAHYSFPQLFIHPQNSNRVQFVRIAPFADLIFLSLSVKKEDSTKFDYLCSLSTKYPRFTISTDRLVFIYL